MYKRKAPSSIAKTYAKSKRAKGQVGPGIALLKGRVAKGYTRRGGFYGRFPPSGNEVKFFDTQVSFTVDTTGEVPTSGQLCLVPQGVTESTRVGRKMVIKSLTMHGQMFTTYGVAASANSTGTTSVYLVLDKQANGAAAAITDIFTSNVVPTSVRNMAYSERFVILKKWEHAWYPSAGVSAAFADTSRVIKFYKKLEIPVEFSSTTGAITEIKSNNLFLCGGASGNGAIDDTVTFAATCRIRFSDS